MKLTFENLRRKNFSPQEFLRSETAERLKINNLPDYGQLTAGMSLADKMQEIRDAVKRPIKITSGFRSRELNKAVGGSPNSWHCQFLACDFNIEGLEPVEAVLLIKETGISVDECFVERACVHMQTNINEALNKNFFGSAVRKNGKWVVSDKIEKV
jgi:zinc D-Ala-D-Ala carboxypeptidase